MNQEKFYALLENPSLLNRETEEELHSLTIKYPFFQTGWILWLKNLRATGNPEFDNALKRAAILVPNRKQLYSVLFPIEVYNTEEIFSDQTNITPPEDTKTVEQNQSQRKNLIEKFLTGTSGTVKLEKSKIEQPRDNADNEPITKSMAENDEIVTETLAMIYFNQKNYDKALDAFKKLRLKYPEKSVYFASRIKEIEKLTNN